MVQSNDEEVMNLLVTRSMCSDVSFESMQHENNDDALCDRKYVNIFENLFLTMKINDS